MAAPSSLQKIAAYLQGGAPAVERLVSWPKSSMKALADDTKAVVGEDTQLRKHVLGEEGFRPDIYKDTRNVLTVGHGFNIEEPSIRKYIPKDVLNGKRLLGKDESLAIADKVLSQAKTDAKQYAGEHYDKLSPEQKTALVDMSYNLGLTKLNKFKELKKGIVAGDSKKMAREVIDSDYAKQLPNRALRNSKLFLVQGDK